MTRKYWLTAAFASAAALLLIGSLWLRAARQGTKELPGDSLKPMSGGVEATVLQVRQALARRDAILPPLGYTIRYQTAGLPTTRRSGQGP